MIQTNPSHTLATILQDIRNELLRIDEPQSKVKLSPDKWSKSEILGHLIDSAINNHRRFVVAQSTDHLIFEGYNQEHWVRAHDYQNRSWTELVNLWFLYNLDLADLISNIPDSILDENRSKHNLDLSAWKTVSKINSVTLRYFILDYIAHLEHHVSQILPSYSSVLIGKY